MSTYLAQLIVAARGDDIGGWMQLLVFLTFVVFWVVGGILKAKAGKDKEEEQEQQPQRPRPALKPPGPMAFQRQQRSGFARPVQRQGTTPKPVARKLQPAPVTAQDQLEELVKPEEQVSVVMPSVKVDLKKGVLETESEPGGVIGLLDIDNPEGLKRAILHYEILGRPLSLRGPENLSASF